MGSVELDDLPGEKPQRKIHLSGFFIGLYEVKWSQYWNYCEAARRRPPVRPSWANGEHPVVGVSWADAVAYCAWAELRLPTEAEWECAARGPRGKRYPWGEEKPNRQRANVHDNVFDLFGKPAQTLPVGSLPAGAAPCGALDMLGNAWEWCQDGYDPALLAKLANGVVDPRGPESASTRVVKGCGATTSLLWCRTTYRVGHGPTTSDSNRGFRVARSSP